MPQIPAADTPDLHYIHQCMCPAALASYGPSFPLACSSVQLRLPFEHSISLVTPPPPPPTHTHFTRSDEVFTHRLFELALGYAAGKWQSANLSTAAAGASEAGTVSMDTSSMSHGSSDTGDDGCSHGTANAARQIAAAPEPIMTNRGSTALSNLGNTKRVGDVNPPNTPPQPFSGVLAGESWYTVPADMQATADQAEAKTVPLTIVFAGDDHQGVLASMTAAVH